MRKLINTFIIIFFFFICGNQESNSQEIEYINSSESKKNDYPFSEATVVNDIIYLSGQIGTLENGKLIDGGIKAETIQTMLNIKSVLEKNGSSLKKVFKCTCMLADIKDWGEMSIEYKKFFTKNMPARSAFAGSGLALNARVEIECWAVK
jgi:reactive intermediate/imine deaminase